MTLIPLGFIKSDSGLDVVDTVSSKFGGSLSSIISDSGMGLAH